VQLCGLLCGDVAGCFVVLCEDFVEIRERDKRERERREEQESLVNKID
jgi:hypothetical protein